MDEQELLERAKGKDAASFGILYDRYIRKVYDFVYFKTHHKETAEDIVSDTFLKALKAIHRIDPEKPFLSWLYRIAQNATIDHYRSKKNRPHDDIDDIWDLSDENVDFIRDLSAKEQLKEAKKYLRKLPSSQRDIVIMRVWQELSYKEIAEITGKSEGACKVAFSRAVSELRRSMPLALALLFVLKM